MFVPGAPPLCPEVPAIHRTALVDLLVDALTVRKTHKARAARHLSKCVGGEPNADASTNASHRDSVSTCRYGTQKSANSRRCIPEICGAAEGLNSLTRCRRSRSSCTTQRHPTLPEWTPGDPRSACRVRGGGIRCKGIQTRPAGRTGQDSWFRRWTESQETWRSWHGSSKTQR